MSVCLSVCLSQSASQSVSQPGRQPVSQPVSQSVGQPVSQTVSQSLSLPPSLSPSPPIPPLLPPSPLHTPFCFSRIPCVRACRRRAGGPCPGRTPWPPAASPTGARFGCGRVRVVGRGTRAHMRRRRRRRKKTRTRARTHTLMHIGANDVHGHDVHTYGTALCRPVFLGFRKFCEETETRGEREGLEGTVKEGEGEGGEKEGTGTELTCVRKN